MYNALLHRLRTRQRIGVIGLGYADLPLSVRLKRRLLFWASTSIPESERIRNPAAPYTRNDHVQAVADPARAVSA